MAVINPVGYLHNVTTHTAQVDRLSSGAGLLLPDAVGSLRPVGGLRHPSDMAMSAPGGMFVRVGPGLAYVPQGQSSLGGAYVLGNDGNLDLAIGTAHATLTRWDLVVVRVQDAFYAGAANQGDIVVIPGVASGTPSDPALPAGSSYVILGRVVVGPGVAAITTPNVLMMASVATVNGGIMRVLSTARPAAALRYDGLEIYEIDTGAHGFWDASGAGVWVMFDTRWQTYTPRIATTTATNYWTQGNGLAVGRYFRKGREVSVEGELKLGSTSVYGGGGTGLLVVDPPAGYYPYTWDSPDNTFANLIGVSEIYGGSFGVGFVAVSGKTGAAAARRFMFYSTGFVAATGTGVGWNISSSGHGVQFQATYHTEFEA
jgi:hypothetical protein